METWKKIIYNGQELNYSISSLGKVKNDKTNYVLKSAITAGYYTVRLSLGNNKGKHFRIHRLVAEAFIPNPNNYNEVNHINEDKTNNSVENLEWVAHKSNISHATCQQRKGETNTARNGRPILCVETNQIYASATVIEKELGYGKGNIWQACNGKIKTAYGYHWAYVENQ